ncbi:ATP-binding cassette domain-containing protein [Dehalococcoidia bacterium]|nr:ATP-binding cassette domain-containing protein [Dehalococcoidia bacterium]
MDSIVVDRLVKRYGEVEAVNDVSFAVREGEIFGFLGPNGAGKTTTINVLCTLLRATSGSAVINGFDVAGQKSEVRRSIGLVFQETTLDDYLTAEQNLLFHSYAYGVPKDLRLVRMKELLTLVDLWDRRSGKTRTYSGGMKRRLEIVRGLIHHPRVLFLDEPTLGLDPQTRSRIWDYLQEIRAKENLTIFLTTHYMDEAEHCDRIAIIDHGSIAAIGTPDRLKENVGGDVVSLRTADNDLAVTELTNTWSLDPQLQDGFVRFSVPRGEEFLPEFVRRFDGQLLSISVRRPTLDDVFLDVTGKDIRDEEIDKATQLKKSIGDRHR